MKKNFYYLVHIQFLGFRFHGWQKQPKLKTVHYMVDKTLDFILENHPYKTHGSGRTDARVSANHYAFELFTETAIDLTWFEKTFDKNLPNDISLLKIEPVNEQFNIIQASKVKEYHYLFSFGEKPHPFSTAIMTYFHGDLGIELMQQGAKIYEGNHNFVRYCSKPTEHTIFNREILHCSIERNRQYTASFFPKTSYVLCIRSQGFLRYQVRFIMAQLIRLGRGETTLEEISESLTGKNTAPLHDIVPGSGLILNKISFENELVD